MAYYSLVASLPALKIGDTPPFSTEEYIENCAQWITEAEQNTLRHVLLNEGNHASSALGMKWNNMETQLRNAALKLRAQKRGVDIKEYLQPHDGFSGTIEVLVSNAFTCKNPADLEKELDQLRWLLSEELIQLAPFSFNKLFSYGIQLQIVERWARMDTTTGTEKLEAVVLKNTEKENQTDTPD